MKFQLINVENSVPGCAIIEFSLADAQQDPSSPITSINSLTTGTSVATTQDYVVVDSHIEQNITFYPKIKIDGDFVEYLPDMTKKVVCGPLSTTIREPTILENSDDLDSYKMVYPDNKYEIDQFLNSNPVCEITDLTIEPTE